MGQTNTQNLAKEFFSSLFTLNHPSNSQIQNITEKSYISLSEESKAFLDREFSSEEIKRVVFQMSKLKAPGPDGFQVGFFQEYWKIVGDDVIGAVKNLFSSSSPISSVNQTFIALIPNIKCSESISDFRHISLCNAFYKIIAKSMANKM